MNGSIFTIHIESLLYLFLIIGIGAYLGKIEVRGMSLGASGALFVGMIFGHYGFKVQNEIRDIGLLLFVYAVGLQVGPRFFRLLKSQGLVCIITAVFAVLVSALVLAGLAHYANLPHQLAVGIYTGAMTNTPALAAATDLFKTLSPAGVAGALSVGYGIAYPFSMFGTAILAKALPKLLKVDPKLEAKRWEQSKDNIKSTLHVAHYWVNNPSVVGRSVSEININRMIKANISRIWHNGRDVKVTPDTTLELGDVVTAVGPTEELLKWELLLGSETQSPSLVDGNLESREVDVASVFVEGRTLSQLQIWEQYEVIITRVRRNEIEYTPTGSFVLEVGDTVRAVGEPKDLDRFTNWIGAHEKRLSETNLISFALGLAFGILLGSLTFHFPFGQIKLGMATGAFIIALLLGHFRRIGPISVYCPPAANNLARELGLLLFLAGAGTTAGEKFVEVVQSSGLQLLGIGALVTISAWATIIAVMHFFNKSNLLTTLGSLSATMTNPPALATASSHSDSELTALAYAATYPLAMLLKVVTAQLLVILLR